MPERLEIILSATDNASGALRSVQSALHGNIDAIGRLAQQYGIYVAGATAAAVAGAALVRVARDSIEATLEYTNEVRRLSQVSGAGAEATSRFIQLLDDHKISANEAEAAMRTMRTQGLIPTVDSLAEASDAFLRLDPGIERTNFLLTTFGRQGANFAEIMLQGGDAIRAQAAAVEEGLILGEQELQQARELELAIDDLNDSKQALSVTIGTALIPGVTRGAEALNQFLGEARVGESIFWTLGRAIYQNLDLPLRALEQPTLAEAAAIRDMDAAMAGIAEASTEAGLNMRMLTEEFIQQQVQAALDADALGFVRQAIEVLRDRHITITVDTVQQYSQFLARGGQFIENAPMATPQGTPAGMGYNSRGQLVQAYWSAETGWYVPGQYGLDGIVPPGFPRDTFPIRVSSGERVRVETPEQQAKDSGGISIGVLNVNREIDEQVLLAKFRRLLT